MRSAVSSEQRKNYTKNSINSLTDTSQYHVEVKTLTALNVTVFQNPSETLVCDSLRQHLTTFVMDRKEAMLTIEDGIRKLRLLDAKGKVWTQDMILQVDGKAVSLIDNDSKVRKRRSGAPSATRVWTDHVCVCFRTSWRTFLWAPSSTVRP